MDAQDFPAGEPILTVLGDRVALGPQRGDLVRMWSSWTAWRPSSGSQCSGECCSVTSTLAVKEHRRVDQVRVNGITLEVAARPRGAASPSSSSTEPPSRTPSSRR